MHADTALPIGAQRFTQRDALAKIARQTLQRAGIVTNSQACMSETATWPAGTLPPTPQALGTGLSI